MLSRPIARLSRHAVACSTYVTAGFPRAWPQLVVPPSYGGALSQYFSSYDNWIDITWIGLVVFCAVNWVQMVQMARPFHIDKVFNPQEEAGAPQLTTLPLL